MHRDALAEQRAYNELCAYSLTHESPAFVHQHVVDAFGAQTANAQTRPIQLAFALVGLYLHIERQFTGREVQRVHRMLAEKTRSWPAFVLPGNRGATTVTDVVAAPSGAERDRAIHTWCASVWGAYREAEPAVVELLTRFSII
jgi:hypothetical protein